MTPVTIFLNLSLRFPLIVKPNYEGSAKGISTSNVVDNEKALFEKIAPHFKNVPLTIFCYENGGVRTVLASMNSSALESAARRLGVAASGTLAHGPVFPSFSDAETRIRQLLKEGLDGRIQP